MLRHLLLTGALVLAAPALAQMQTPPADPPAPQSGPPSTTDVPASSEAQTSPQPDTATPTETTAAAKSSPSDIIATEFPGYDADKSGDLSKAEFSKWMLALREKSPQASEKKSQAELDKWTGTAFTQADSDKNKKVSQAELSAFLTAKK